VNLPFLKAPFSRINAISHRGRRGAWLRRLLLGAALLLVMAGLAAAAGWKGLEVWGDRRVGAPGKVGLEISRGASLDSIARRLTADGVVDHKQLFMVYAWREGKHRSLQAGDYAFDLPMSPREVIEQLQRGSFERRLTIPEGWTARQIAEALVRDGWIEDPSVWLDLVARPVPEGILAFPVEGGSEGYCFPDTYFLEEGTPPDQIHHRMLRRFARVWEEIQQEHGSRDPDPRSSKLTPPEVVTLASMIQREARGIEELPAIASVYLNRMKIGMRLQCCATVHYALGEVWDRPLLHKDLKIDSPYNTYQHYGLPPGPIGNPGKEAITAVLWPEQNDFLYYVYRGDGTHAFTKTYREHMAAARRYRAADPNADLIKGRAETASE
jgi:UPF0755 protein